MPETMSKTTNTMKVIQVHTYNHQVHTYNHQGWTDEYCVLSLEGWTDEYCGLSLEGCTDEYCVLSIEGWTDDYCVLSLAGPSFTFSHGILTMGMMKLPGQIFVFTSSYG